MGLHLTLTVTWQMVVVRDAQTMGSLLPLWSVVPVPLDYFKIGAAVLLCVVAGTSRLWAPDALPIERNSILGLFHKQYLATAATKLITMVPAALLMGAAESPVNAFAMVIVITLATRSVVNELLELYADGLRG